MQESTVYRLVQVDLNGHTKTSNVVSFVKRGIQHYNKNVKIYPNPAYDEVRIEIHKNQEESVVLEMYDLLGNKVNIVSTGISANSNRADLRLDVSNLPKSTYIVKVLIGTKTISKKLTVL